MPLSPVSVEPSKAWSYGSPPVLGDRGRRDVARLDAGSFDGFGHAP
jgi:hypothetical protein